MDMYQKREMRKKKSLEAEDKTSPKTSINWYSPTYRQQPLNPCKY